ncbi:DUF6414 family protein [Kribbella karoonensis]|uniref:Uncharacterized protein n=1 Tax=Kribbella karoonensis TaxID=324851 RepID=A0ABN2DNC2_9ACTN
MGSDGRGSNEASSHVPSISIYQNAGHVTGILQQLFEEGVLTATEWQKSEEAADVLQRTTKLGASAEIGADVPFLAKAAGTFTGSRDKQRTENDKQSNTLRQQYVYSHSYYLHLVLRTLREKGRIKTVTSGSDASELRPGDLIEFQASFRADEIGAILDIASPDFVGAIVERQVRGEMIKVFDQDLTFDQRQNLIEKYKAKAEMQRDFAKSITQAVRVDFRSDATQEYFGTFGPESDLVTAVVICESDQFLVADKDRLLDGAFTVFGKVSASIETDVPLLHRNKLLYRINSEFVDAVFEQLQSAGTDAVEQGNNPVFQNTTGEQLLNTRFAARLNGPSFKVVPIAISL